MPPITLSEKNPHYLNFRGHPTVLITSGEHYGAVLNRRFDYVRYLDALAADGLNLTRTFSGTYREIPGSFGIVDNVLAPEPDQFICPFKRVDATGGFLGGGIYDLDQWDEAYFDRLKDFVAEADKRDIVVELVLFCFWYNDELWRFSPMHADNAATGGGTMHRDEVYGSPDANLLMAVQEAVTRKIVTELNALDNLYYEIMNEPYSCHDHTDFDEWQRRIVDVIVQTESALPQRHLIARNIHNRTKLIRDPDPGVSIFNFHYADPDAALSNYHLGKVLGDDETGFGGQAATPYRYEAWQFMLSGGGVFSHLDYSFTVDHPDGTAPIRGETPGFGSPAWRSQLAVLKRFIESVDFEAMAPHNECIRGHLRPHAGAASVLLLADPPNAYAVYICGGGANVDLALGIPQGTYQAQWIRPSDGQVIRQDTCTHDKVMLRLRSPAYAEDLALRLVAVSE